MSLGALQSEADLRRFVENLLRTLGVIPSQATPAISLIKAGVPSDEDFPRPPGDGLLALDSSTNTLYARAGGSWVAV